MGTRIMHGRTGIWLHFPGKIIYGLLQVQVHICVMLYRIEGIVGNQTQRSSLLSI